MTTLTYRPWGYYEIMGIDQEHVVPRYVVKRIVVNTGEKLSLQSHKKRKEFWVVVKGKGVVVVGDREFSVAPYMSTVIEPYIKHRIINTGKDELVIVETQVGVCKEDDIFRYEDIYGRC